MAFALGMPGVEMGGNLTKAKNLIERINALRESRRVLPSSDHDDDASLLGCECYAER